MSSRQLTFLLVAAIVLGAIGWILFHRGARSWESEPTAGRQKVIEFPLNDVTQITIKDGTGELNLVRKTDRWVLRERADYPANFEEVSRLLQKVWHLKPVQNLQVGPSQLARLDLVAPVSGSKSGTLLDLKNKDGKRSPPSWSENNTSRNRAKVANSRLGAMSCRRTARTASPWWRTRFRCW